VELPDATNIDTETEESADDESRPEEVKKLLKVKMSSPIVFGEAADNSMYNDIASDRRTSARPISSLSPKRTFQVERSFRQYDTGRSHTQEISVTFLTARPGILRNMTEELLITHGVQRPVLLMGAFKYLVGHVRMASKKIKNQLQYFDLWPEMYFVFIGDSGQGDADVAQELLHYEQVKDVFIHDISPTEQERSSLSRMLHFPKSSRGDSSSASEEGIHDGFLRSPNLFENAEGLGHMNVTDRRINYMKTYLGAAHHAARSRLVSEDGLARVAVACVDDIMKVGLLIHRSLIISSFSSYSDGFLGIILPTQHLHYIALR
jgi:hypothetical protein